MRLPTPRSGKASSLREVLPFEASRNEEDPKRERGRSKPTCQKVAPTYSSSLAHSVRPSYRAAVKCHVERSRDISALCPHTERSAPCARRGEIRKRPPAANALLSRPRFVSQKSLLRKSFSEALLSTKRSAK